MMIHDETRTASMLERVPKILAVTAHSFGLSLQARESRQRTTSGQRHGAHRPMASDGKGGARR